LNKTLIKTKLLNLKGKSTNANEESKANKRPTSADVANVDESLSGPVSFIINPNDIEMLKNKSGKDEVLGIGHFGIVKKAVWTTHTGSRVTLNKALSHKFQPFYKTIQN
jgi:hypothetical protein